jgi:hypothetical protein
VLEAQIASLRELIQDGHALKFPESRTSVETPRSSMEQHSMIQHGPYHAVDGMQGMNTIHMASDQYDPPNPNSCTHEDQNSFMLSASVRGARHTDDRFLRERMIDDNGPTIRSSASVGAGMDADADAGPGADAGDDTDGDADASADADADAGPSPSEAHVAGAISHNGNLAVHGVSSIFHNPGRFKTVSDVLITASAAERKVQNQISQSRLIANASIQHQRENILLRGSSLGIKINLDGVNPELAFHLLSLHWNRQHYTYLISYRPAIMDSLMNNGPYVNTLLLNSIYFSSSIITDRIEVRSDPDDPQSAGLPFYNRFRALLADHIDKPSIPTSTALLLCGASLVSAGRPSAGWIMCGIAYRMIIDLGCHMTVDSRQKDRSNEMALHSDIDLEIRKRLFWGAFLTDATQSLYFGRPPSFRASQARVSHLLLDTFEELEEWTPYIDPLCSSNIPPYPRRPAYAISTFTLMTSLFSISSKIVHSFYSIKSLKDSSQHIRNVKTAVVSELDQWNKTIPQHLRFDPETDSTPPPHQVTPL